MTRSAGVLDGVDKNSGQICLFLALTRRKSLIGEKIGRQVSNNSSERLEISVMKQQK